MLQQAELQPSSGPSVQQRTLRSSNRPVSCVSCLLFQHCHQYLHFRSCNVHSDQAAGGLHFFMQRSVNTKMHIDGLSALA